VQYHKPTKRETPATNQHQTFNNVMVWTSDNRGWRLIRR
jgi:hypothetical protein